MCRVYEQKYEQRLVIVPIYSRSFDFHSTRVMKYLSMLSKVLPLSWMLFSPGRGPFSNHFEIPISFPIWEIIYQYRKMWNKCPFDTPYACCVNFPNTEAGWFSDICVKLRRFILKKMRLRMFSAKMTWTCNLLCKFGDPNVIFFV